MKGKNNVTSCTKCSFPQSIVYILIQPLLFVKNSFLLKCQINSLHTQCGGTRLCIRSCLLRELTASQLVAIATRSDAGSPNILDLIQSLVPPHYVCNGYVLAYYHNLHNVWNICLVFPIFVRGKHHLRRSSIRKRGCRGRNQWPLPITLYVRIPLMTRRPGYNIM